MMTLRTRAVLFTAASIAMVALTLIIASVLIQVRAEQRFETAITNAKKLFWQEIIASQLGMMEAGMTGLTRDRELRNALRSGNNERLQETALTTYWRMNTSKVLTKLQILDAGGEQVFSAPESKGAIDNPLVSQVLSDGKIARGLVRDSDNELLAQIVFPLSMRGKLIGIAIFSRHLSDAIEEFKQNDGSEVSIVSTSGNNELSSDENFYRKLSLALPLSQTSEYRRITVGEKTFGVAISAIKDPEDVTVGYLVTASDYSESYASQRVINTISFALALVMILIIIGISSWYMKRLFEPLNVVVRNLQSISEGDLTVTFDSTNSQDEIGLLVNAVASMTEQLRKVIGEVRNIVAELNYSTKEMADIADGTNHGVQQQLGETTQVATAINQMSSTVQEVVNHTSNAVTSATDANDQVLAGQKVVNQSLTLIKSMAGNIDHSSKVINQLDETGQKIGSVLDVIRSIAEQTNLLALNAAIEAARAGEQGRGFAVVADEVRTLASRTQQSTEDIQEMISQLQQGIKEAVSSMEQSIVDVQNNVEHSEQTEASLNTLTDAIQTISQMNIQIATASEQQAAVSGEISHSIANIKTLAGNSATGVQKTADFSVKLNSMATELDSLIKHFQI